MTKRLANLDSLVLIFSFIVLAQLLSYVVSQGAFDREPFPDNPDRMMVVAGTYEEVAAEKQVTLLFVSVSAMKNALPSQLYVWMSWLQVAVTVS